MEAIGTGLSAQLDRELAKEAIVFFAKQFCSLLLRGPTTRAYKRAVSVLGRIRHEAKGWQSKSIELQNEYKLFKVYGTCMELILARRLPREEAVAYVLRHWARLRGYLRELIPDEEKALKDIYEILSSDRFSLLVSSC